MSTLHDLWVSVCAELKCDGVEKNWRRLVEWSPPGTVWHSLEHCVLYQAALWKEMEAKGAEPAVRPILFRLALLIRHLAPNNMITLFTELLPSSEDKTLHCEYLVGILMEEKPRGFSSLDAEAHERATLTDQTFNEVFKRDVDLFEDLELAVLSAPRDVYMLHSKLVRAEYPQMEEKEYLGLRLKVLERFTQIPKLYNTEDFAEKEAAARENISVEINEIRQKLHNMKTE